MSEITKESIRQNIWTYMEENNISSFPRPVFNRIPNFKGAEQACCKVLLLREFQTAGTVKVNPDKPQQHARFLTLEANKTLLVPTPRLRSGLFNKITPPPNPSKHVLRICSSSEGVKSYSSKVGLNSKVTVDVVIIGSVAVSLNGRRIGKGEGYADMEFAMMATMGAVNSNTPVITTVHDCQVMESIPDELFGEHDVPVDIIVTPTRIIRCETPFPKPTCILWSLLTDEKLNKIPILRILKEMEKSNH
ncbi:methenyltetrahydrofolate synthase domain-containing protein-like isoform X1 [Uloborus diversus]|uniref:methenyltetrahydrofolate synthase domain-containing protein-like isoform X1 n=1 Tax=Uloborus diversus TaxID=327109 RepID=UPI00240A183C|nr:methenyltetrahydrofolate synthase domain-containing protein-like isoform X1 [Uloborus diversus]